MGFLDRFTLGDGKLKSELRTALEAEGPVLIEEGVWTWIHYHRFKAPGKRFYGKRSGERAAIGISEKRLVLYCRSGSVELVDSPFSEERLRLIGFEVESDKLAIRIDYDRLDVPDVSGQITITLKTSRAAEIADQVRARIAN